MTTITLRPGQVPLADLAQIYWTNGAAVLDRSFNAAIEKGGPPHRRDRRRPGRGTARAAEDQPSNSSGSGYMSPDLKAPSDLRRLRALVCAISPVMLPGLEM
jgi:hypothetical protein